MSSSGRVGDFSGEAYGNALCDLRRTLDEVDVVGFSKRHAELAVLERLVAVYPDEARRFLGCRQ